MDPRFPLIYRTASRLFIRQGYAQTQINHIVKESGISVGAIYTLFTGKKAILCFILKCTIDPGYMEEDLETPMDEGSFSGLNDDLMAFFEENNNRFAARLADRAVGYSFQEMLSDAYDIIYHYGTGCLIIEKNPRVMGPIRQTYVDFRMKYFYSIVEYVRIFEERGEVRPLDQLELCVNLMVEAMSWWGMHMKNDAFQPREDVPDDLAKRICLDALVHAYRK